MLPHTDDVIKLGLQCTCPINDHARKMQSQIVGLIDALSLVARYCRSGNAEQAERVASKALADLV